MGTTSPTLMAAAGPNDKTWKRMSRTQRRVYCVVVAVLAGLIGWGWLALWLQ